VNIHEVGGESPNGNGAGILAIGSIDMLPTLALSRVGVKDSTGMDSRSGAGLRPRRVTRRQRVAMDVLGLIAIIACVVRGVMAIVHGNTTGIVESVTLLIAAGTLWVAFYRR